MSFERSRDGVTFKRARAHRSYSKQKRAVPQPPPKILIKRKAAPEKPPEVVTLPPKPAPKPTPVVKPKPAPALGEMTIAQLLELAKTKGLKATTKMSKAQLITLIAR